MLKRKIILPPYRRIHKLLEGRGLKKYSLVQSINNLFQKKLYVTYVEIKGNKMNLSNKPEYGDSLELSSLGSFEPFETEILEKKIKKGDFVIDLGASVGYYTLLFAKLVGDSGKVFSFESDPDKFAVLEKNVHLNNYQNIILVQKYVSNKSTTNSEINLISLDDYFKQYNNPINIIKMDIEGAEVRALEGMRMLLEKNKNIKILTEFHTRELKKNGSEPKDLLNNLKQLGFSIYNIDEKNKKLENITNEELLKNYPDEEIFTNLFCLRK